MARRQRSRRATIVRDLVLGLAVVTVGAGGLWVAWQMRPAEFRNQPASAPPTTVETQAELMADRPDWIAWANGHPLCMEMGRTEEIARQHVGQAVQPACAPSACGRRPIAPARWEGRPKAGIPTRSSRWARARCAIGTAPRGATCGRRRGGRRRDQ